jgi:cytochrome c oxidase subunit IV
MASHMTYEESKKRVFQGLLLLGGVTLIEVFLSLLGKGYIIPGAEDYAVVFFIVGLALIVLSLYKAYFIVYEFMHMRYEVKSLALTVLMPMLLLIWAIIAFFQEGNSWKERRDLIQEKNEEEPVQEEQLQGYKIDETTDVLLKG